MLEKTVAEKVLVSKKNMHTNLETSLKVKEKGRILTAILSRSICFTGILAFVSFNEKNHTDSEKRIHNYQQEKMA